MNERYIRLQDFPKNLYAEGVPVLIEAGALLKDSLTDALLVQMKFRNISEKEIASVTINVRIWTGSEMIEQKFTYSRLSADIGEEFGQNTPILLASKEVLSAQASILSVTFADKTEYRSAHGEELSSASAEMLECLQQGLDNTIKKRKNKKVQRLAWLPLVVVCIPFLYCTYWAIQGVRFDVIFNNKVSFQEIISLGIWYGIPGYLLSLLVPIMCLLVVFQKEPKIKRIEHSYRIAIGCAIIQMLAVILVFFSKEILSYMGYWMWYRIVIGSRSFIDGSWVGQDLRDLVLLEHSRTYEKYRDLCMQFMFLLKNPLAIYVLSRWRKLNK